MVVFDGFVYDEVGFFGDFLVEVGEVGKEVVVVCV